MVRRTFYPSHPSNPSDGTSLSLDRRIRGAQTGSLAPQGGWSGTEQTLGWDSRQPTAPRAPPQGGGGRPAGVNRRAAPVSIEALGRDSGPILRGTDPPLFLFAKCHPIDR